MCDDMKIVVSPALLALCAILIGQPVYAQSVEVIGTLTNEGVECRAMRGDDGLLYTLVPKHRLASFQPGDRVKVVGTTSQYSFCMLGTTIAVEQIEPVK
jgi:hypothetical protein